MFCNLRSAANTINTRKKNGTSCEDQLLKNVTAKSQMGMELSFKMSKA